MATGNNKAREAPYRTASIQVQVGCHRHLTFIVSNSSTSRESPLPLWIAASRHSSISEHTLCILEKLLEAPDGRLDVRLLERHLLDVIGIMEGLCLIQRKAAGHVQWM